MSDTPYGAVETPDGRYYVVNPGTPQEERFRSVTAALGRWDKDGLLPWAATLAAKGAFDELPALVGASMLDDCGRTYGRCKIDHPWNEPCPDCRCKKCEACLVRWMRDRHVAESHRRSDEGTRVHHMVRDWVATGRWSIPESDIEVYVKSFRAFVVEYGLTAQDWELYEARVLNRAHMYAGTLDAIVHFHRGRSKATDDLLDRLTRDGQPRVQHALLLIDYKTREKEERAIFLDMPLQLAGYRFAEVVRLKSEQELPMPKVDGAAIVQIRPDVTSLELVLAEEPEFAAFLSLLGADEWALERGKRAVGARTHSYAPSVVRERARDARRARKTLAQDVALGLTDSELVEVSEAAAKLKDKQDNSPQARGARAAAAARRGVSPVLAEMKAANADTMRAAVVGAAGGVADTEIPF